MIPLGTTEKDVRLYHMHIDPRFGESDLRATPPGIFRRHRSSSC
jgi:hypothetical protein